MKVLVKELFQSDSLTGSIEICGKVIYADIGNKNIIIKVDDGSGWCNCFTRSDAYSPKFSSLLGKYVIVTGHKSLLFREFGIDIKNIYEINGLNDEMCWKLLKLKEETVMN